MSRLSLIAAIGADFAIGQGPDLPWSLPDDFRYFKQTTLGHPIIMGRATFDSLGKPLPGRQNLIITRQKEAYEGKGGEVFGSLEEAIYRARELDDEEIFVIGGAMVYTQALPLADRLYLTEIEARFPEADVHFPHIDWDDWGLLSTSTHEVDARHLHRFHFNIYERRG